LILTFSKQGKKCQVSGFFDNYIYLAKVLCKAFFMVNKTKSYIRYDEACSVRPEWNQSVDPLKAKNIEVSEHPRAALG
jgi:hypothetical protein